MSATLLRSVEGHRIDLEVGRWRLEPDDIELALLCSLVDPVLDVGCGPGRIPAALAALGRVALGIDPSPSAAGEAGRRGAPVLRRSVFDPLPGEGRWGAVLLLDGNIGIGGDPITLLERCGELVCAGGAIVAEVALPGAVSAPLTVRVESGGRAGPWFDWAVVGADAWPGIARAAGLRPDGIEPRGDRWFARAVRPDDVEPGTA